MNLPLYDQAVVIVTDAGFVSASQLREHFGIGYAKAVQLIDALEAHGVVGAAAGDGPRPALNPNPQTGLFV